RDRRRKEHSARPCRGYWSWQASSPSPTKRLWASKRYRPCRRRRGFIRGQSELGADAVRPPGFVFLRHHAITGIWVLHAVTQILPEVREVTSFQGVISASTKVISFVIAR